MLFEKYSKAVFNVAYRITNDYDVSNDVLQEGFIEVFKDLEKFRKESSLGSWIKTIVVRAALRKIKIENRFEKLSAEHDQIVEWKDDFDAEELDKAIRSLPQGYRTVFLLVEKEGYKHKEIAKMLDISEGTSKSQLFYAKKMLQQKLTRY
jgi:RNA polymerase sigma factor (sigma-70 family)